ncbi:MAG: transposase [Planctomycetes bacterium]|nr:transposase [Planctomycetota bacterium]
MGDPNGVARGWHSRGYLPHYDGRATQHVTFHLADSLPPDVLKRIAAELDALPLQEQDMERRKRVDSWLDAGHGCCVLRSPALAAMAQAALKHFDCERYSLLAWAIMPNHIHVLFRPAEGQSASTIIATWKKFTARRILDSAGKSSLVIGPVPKPVWHREYWDRYIRNERHFRTVVDYIHNNPVKAGLVARPQDWPWSSAVTQTS